MDSENKRISVGLKQATEDPWLRIGETYPVGSELKGKVVRLMDNGVVVDFRNDIEGFVPVSQLSFGQPVNAVTGIPAEQPPRPETPSKVIPMESDDYNLSDPIRPVPEAYVEEPA